MKYVTIILRWLARIFSLFSIVTLIMAAIKEGIILSGMEFKELTLIMFFPFGVIFGMVIAWWSEGLGGGIAVLSLIGFYISMYIFYGTFPHGYDYLKATSPAAVFIFYSLLTYNSRHREKYL